MPLRRRFLVGMVPNELKRRAYSPFFGSRHFQSNFNRRRFANRTMNGMVIAMIILI